MPDLARLIKTRDRGIWMAVVWIPLWLIQVTKVFVYHQIPQTRWESVMTSILIVAGPFITFKYWQSARDAKAALIRATQAGRTVEDRLDELERLKRRDMVTPEEYAAKRQEILKDL